jgi:hypothetical protein
MENRRNYYRILHVQPDAPVEIIRTSYRTLMQRLRAHPDLGGDHWNAALINEAYAVLNDPARRAAYDEGLAVRVAPVPGAGVPPPRPALAPPPGEQRRGHCEFCRTPSLHEPHDEEACCRRCGTPLNAALHRHFESSGRRAIGRLDRNYPVKMWTSWPDCGPFTGTTRDVSLNGVQVLTDQPLRAGQLVKLDCEPFAALIRVLASDPPAGTREPQWRIRAEFVTVRFRRAQGAFLSVRA